ncbi:hypothetical protein [Aeromonas enteropelogenes]|uniref:hypothetical protein n=1 Tax=Aeromonas enteropelogenes TaxID=29489 RepID=UPI0009E51F50|nr:hypothetical protein [Aeromonas enteropelogenes]UBH57058.1 hypothetical protein LA341_03830 [Aeromonas enteropelogenes]
MRLATIAALILLSSSASAECIGTGDFKTCYDNSGNTYTVQKFGNSTYVNGQNSNTGSNWHQRSQQFGNSTYTTGQDADGNSWNSTATKVGNSTFINGTDSDGNTFRRTCNEYGCY